VLWCYLHGFAIACSQKARAWSYVDGMAGSGVNRIGATNIRLPGSPILGLETQPEFTRCLLMEANPAHFRALRARTARYQGRAIALPGDSNRDLVPAMENQVDPRSPCLCVLDPEGSELQWSTVRDISQFRHGRMPRSRHQWRDVDVVDQTDHHLGQCSRGILR
jgi:three-Cys-motif partner protein